MAQMFRLIKDLKPNSKNDKLLPSLSEFEMERLKERIRKYGFTEEVEITKDDIILDGHNRINILKNNFKELGILEVPCRIIDIPEVEDFFRTKMRTLNNAS